MEYYDAKMFRKFLPADYRKRKVAVLRRNTVTLMDLNWSGGTRYTYAVLELATGRRCADTSKYSQLAPWANPAEGATLPIPVGAIVVQTGAFCGKQATAYIYINPENDILEAML